MTIHIQYDHTCPECGASYIPYGTSVRCPRCGVFEEEGRLIHYIEMAAHSCRNNFVYHGRFTPVAYATTTLSDALLYWVFCLLDEFTAKGKPQSFTDFACDYASKTEFTGQEYLRCCYQWYSRGSSASIFCDIMVLLQHSGRCLIGVGSADGENHALEAATRAVHFPLLTPERLNQAKQCFVFMRGGCDMSIKEVMEMSTHVRHLACEACIFSVGVYTDATSQEAMHVALIAVDSTPGD